MTFFARSQTNGNIHASSLFYISIRSAAFLAIAMLSCQLFLASPAHAGAIIDTPITVSGSGNNEDVDLSNDTTLTGDVLAVDQGSVTITVTDTSGISGALTADRNGIIYLTASDNAWISGKLDMRDGGDGEVTLTGNTLFSGDIAVESSGGYLNLTMNDSASLTGLLSSGSHSISTVIVNDSASITGGVRAFDGGEVHLTMSGATTLSGGLTATGTGELWLTASGDVAVDSALDVDGGSAATLELADNVAFTGDMTVIGSGKLDLTASDNVVIQGGLTTGGGGVGTFVLSGSTAMTGDVTTNSGGTSTMILNDSAALTGDVFTDAGTTTTLTLNDNSVLTGSSAITWGTANISLNGAGTAWYVTQSSRTSAAAGATGSDYASVVSNLSLADGAWVYLGAKQYNMTGMADRVQLDINSLSGSGNFELRLHVAGLGSSAYNDGDLIHVTTTDGDHTLSIPGTALGLGGVAVNGEEVLKVVHSLDGGGSFALYEGKPVDIGHYKYKLVQNSNHWYLVADGSTGSEGATTIPGTGVELPPNINDLDPGFGVQVDPDTTPLNRPAETGANFMTANYLVTYMEQQTLLQRMGDLRHCRQGDVWVRGFAGTMNSKRFKQLSSYSMNYYGFQIGADRNIRSVSENFFAGIMAGYTRGDPDHSNSSSDIESYHAGLYALYGTEDDFYIDATAKFSHIRNKYSTTASDGFRVKGSGSGNAYSLNLEAGKRFYVSELRRGLYIEPQVQAMYTRQEKIALSADNGLDSRMDGYNSVLLRAGGLLGYDIKETGAVPLNVYVKAGYVRELAAGVDVQYNKVRHRKYDYKDGWFDAGVGITTELAEKHAVYLDLEYATGKRFNKRQANIGYRYTF